MLRHLKAQEVNARIWSPAPEADAVFVDPPAAPAPRPRATAVPATDGSGGSGGAQWSIPKSAGRAPARAPLAAAGNAAIEVDPASIPSELDFGEGVGEAVSEAEPEPQSEPVAVRVDPDPEPEAVVPQPLM